jgi:cytochrome c2
MSIHETHHPHGEQDDAKEHESRVPKHLPHHPSHDARVSGRWVVGILALTVLYFIGLAVHDRFQEHERVQQEARMLTGGDPRRGRALARTFGCAGCHTIPGVIGADGQIGPPLDGIANRMYIGGVVTNTPEDMVRWIMNPKAIDARTAMPVVGVDEVQARDIAAYLYTLR